MKCRVCGGPLEHRVADFPFKIGDASIVVVKALPVLECRQCGPVLSNRCAAVVAQRTLYDTGGFPISASLAPRARGAGFRRFLHLSGSAKAGEGRQLFNDVDNRLSNIPSGGGIVLLDVFNGGFKLVGRFGCPPNPPHEWNSWSIRLSTSWCSTNSPRSACPMPLCTPAMKRA